MTALLVRGSTRPDSCAGVAVVVSAEPARGVCAWPAPRLADRFTVWKDGPVAIWLEPHGARVLTDREDRGDRPWVPPPPKPRPRPVSNLPMAPLDAPMDAPLDAPLDAPADASLETPANTDNAK
jgi:competence protein ComEC